MKTSIVLTALSSVSLGLVACGGSGPGRQFGAGGTGAMTSDAVEQSSGAGGAGGSGGTAAGGSGGTAEGGGGAAQGGAGGAADAVAGGSGGVAQEVAGGSGGAADGGVPQMLVGPDAGAEGCAFGFVAIDGACVEACTQLDCGTAGTCDIDGNGDAFCACDTGFDGDVCDACAPGYRQVITVKGEPMQCELDTPPTVDMAVWLDAADADTFTLSGTSVVNWDSKVAGGYFSTPDSSTRPTRMTPWRGSLPVVKFDGVDDRIHRLVDFGGASYSIFIVGNASGSQSMEQVFLSGPGQSDIDRNILLSARQSATDLLFRHKMPGGMDEVTAAFDTTKRTLIEAHRAWGGLVTAVMVYDGTGYESVVATQGPFDQSIDLHIGRKWDSTLGALDGSIGEVIIFAPALAPDARQDVRDYLAAKWEI